MENTMACSGIIIALHPLTLADYMEARQYVYGPEYLRYDSPDRPLPTADEDMEFWDSQVRTGEYISLAIRRLADNALVGYISAFDFDRNTDSCESGINIFPPENFGKGYGTEAYRLFIPFLGKEHGIRQIVIMTHPLNIPAQRLYKKLGFQYDGTVADTMVEWVKMIRKSV